MLTSLHIENFKGIKSGSISDLAQVNVLVGRNNSGKSTILDALLLMRCAFARQDHLGNDGLFQTVRRRVARVDPKLSPSLRELHYMLRVDPPVLVAAFVGGAQLSQSWEPEQQRGLLTIGVDDPRQEERRFHSSPQLHVDRPQIGNDPVETVLGEALTQQIGHIFSAHLLDPTVIRTPLLETFWGKLLLDRRDAKVRDMVNTLYRLEIETFSQTKFGQYDRLVALMPKHSVAVDWLGDGLRYALNILSLGVLLEGTILMVEELETHQHPESLKLLVQTLFELAKRQNLQLFLTTHSWELMTYALDAAEEKEISLRMVHTRLKPDGTFDGRSVDKPDAKMLMDIGHDIRVHEKYMRP